MSAMRTDGPADHHDDLGQTERQQVTQAEFDRARRFLHGSGILPAIEQAIAAARKSAAGRPAAVSVEALLLGMLICSARHHGKVILETVTDLLAQQLPCEVRDLLALPWWPDTAVGHECAYTSVRNTFHAVAAVMDPSPLPKRRLSHQVVRQIEAAADQALLARRADLLMFVTNSMLEQSLRPAKALLAQHWDGSLCVDATVIRSYSKGVSKTSDRTATDPDAGWYFRTRPGEDKPAGAKGGKPTGTGSRKKKPANKPPVFGYEATLVIADNAEPPPISPDLPTLVLGMAVHKPGVDPGRNALRVFLDLARRGYRLDVLAAADRAYNNSEAESFQVPIRRLGVLPAFDFRIDQNGIQATYGGAQLVDGTWHCPQMPENLVTSSVDVKSGQIDALTWRARNEARSAYKLRRKERPAPDGTLRMMCPAVGPSPTVTCPLRPSSLGRGAHLPLVDVTPSPSGPPTICKQHSITIPVEAGAKHWQLLEYGSAEWVRKYFHLRNCVEGMNNYAKAGEDIGRTRTRCVRGVGAQTLLLAFQLAHTNQRKIRRWMDTTSLSGVPARARPSNRNKTSDPILWTPIGWLRSLDGPEVIPNDSDQ